MRHPVRTLVLLLVAGWLGGCAPDPPLPSAGDGPAVREIHIVSNGWHTVIVLPRAAVADLGRLPEAADFPDAAFLELGWGDRDYFPAKETTLRMTLDAALKPTPAVMHMAGRAHLPQGTRPGSSVVRLMLTERAFERLVRAIADGFERPAGARAQPIAPGLTARSHFYPAEGRFHLFNTCNTWTARMLRAAGIDVSPSGVMTAEDLMSRLRAAARRRSRE